MTTQFQNIASRKYITEKAILTSLTNRGKFVHLGEIDKRRVSDLVAQAADLGNEFQIAFVLTRRTRAAVGMKYSYRGEVYLGCKALKVETKVNKKTKKAKKKAKELKTKNAEIIKFFQKNFGMDFDSTAEDCWEQLHAEILIPLEDHDVLMGGFRDDLADTARTGCSHTCDCDYFRKIQQGAQLFGLTAKQIADGDYEEPVFDSAGIRVFGHLPADQINYKR